MDRWDYSLTNADVDFLVEVAAPEVIDKPRLKQIVEQDEDFRKEFLGDEKIVRRIVEDKEAFLKISPRLYFEVLLRRTLKLLAASGYTIEREGTRKIAVFDIDEVVELLSKQMVLAYLADMLSSFTRIESFIVSFRAKKGIWRRIRFSDMDIDSLMAFAEHVDEPRRLACFKRIADICLFVLGMFPDYIEYHYRYPASRELRPIIGGQARRSIQDYEAEGRKFYKLAAEHPFAGMLEQSEVFRLFHGNFHMAQKPLRFIAEHFLHYERHNVFGLGSG